MTESAILYSVKHGIATLSINRAARKNAITQQMWQQLTAYFEQISADSSIRAVVLTGTGDSFSAGADITEFAALAKSPQQLQLNNQAIQLAQQMLEELPRPTIAMISGACVGGGCGLALSCDFRIAADNAFFAITPAKLGLIYSYRDTRRLLALVGPAKTKELLYTAKRLSAAEAATVGLINQQVSAAELASTTYTLAEQLAAAAQSSLRNIKQVIASLEGYGNLTQPQCEQLFNDAFYSEDCAEGLAAFLQKKPAHFKWG